MTRLKNSSKLLAKAAARLICGLALMLPMLAPAAAAQQMVNPDGERLKAFQDRLQQYVDLQHKAEGQLSSLGKTDEPAKTEAHRKALADAIRRARPDARQGDIFGDAGEQLRLIIKQDAHNRSTRDALAAMKEVQKMKPRVNAEYPEQAALATVPPLILQRLQQLPDGMEYRFMGRDLILRDVKANLIIDFVHEAVPTVRR